MQIYVDVFCNVGTHLVNKKNEPQNCEVALMLDIHLYTGPAKSDVDDVKDLKLIETYYQKPKKTTTLYSHNKPGKSAMAVRLTPKC